MTLAETAREEGAQFSLPTALVPLEKWSLTEGLAFALEHMHRWEMLGQAGAWNGGAREESVRDEH